MFGAGPDVVAMLGEQVKRILLQSERGADIAVGLVHVGGGDDFDALEDSLDGGRLFVGLTRDTSNGAKP